MAKIPSPESRQAESYPDFAMGAPEPRFAGSQKIFLFSPKAIEFSELPPKKVRRPVDVTGGVVPDLLHIPVFYNIGNFGKLRGGSDKRKHGDV
jgi:hypothetical protein